MKFKLNAVSDIHNYSSLFDDFVITKEVANEELSSDGMMKAVYYAYYIEVDCMETLQRLHKKIKQKFPNNIEYNDGVIVDFEFKEITIYDGEVEGNIN